MSSAAPRPVVVYSSLNHAEAHLVRSLLTREGIGSRLRNQHRVALMGEIPTDDARIEVLVLPEESERALALIAGYDKPTALEWHCAACGEANPPAFELCWKCGEER